MAVIIKNLLRLFLATILLIPHAASAQSEILKDTSYFVNNGKKVMVVHTTNRQYYKDSTCIWEVTYPEIFGLANRAMESSANLMLSEPVSFGDCTEEKCDRSTMYFPLLDKFWDRVKISGIQNDLLSYGLLEGSCPSYAKICFTKTNYKIFNLSTGLEVSRSTLFRKDPTSQKMLDSLIVSKMDFTPEYFDVVNTKRQFYFEKDQLYAFYDVYTLGRNQTYSYSLPYHEIKTLINPKGILNEFYQSDSGQK